MKKKFSRLAAILLVLMAQSCSDDGSVINGGSNDGDNSDCEDASCPDGKYCYQGQCKSPVKEGKKCLDGVPCVDGTKCVKGVCKAVASENDDEDGDDTCKSKSDCKGDMVCVDGECIVPIEDGGACQADEFCGKGARCLSGECTPYQKDGEDCDLGIDDICDPETSFCLDNKCMSYLQKGDACEGILMLYCAPGLDCVDGICVGLVQEGGSCSEFDKCANGAICDGGVCKVVAKVGEACGSNNRACEEGSICQNDVCLKIYGECQSNSDCNADSYCCLMDSCSVKNICFPYGEGPGGNFNTECQYQLEPGLFEASVQCEWPLASDNVTQQASQIMATMMVADLPFDSNGASEIVAATFGSSINIFNGQDCTLHQSIKTNRVMGSGTIALGDIDNDGLIEIVAGQNGATAWHWDVATKQYVEFWLTSAQVSSGWGGPSIHDINNDGYPEVLISWGVFDGRTGRMLNNASAAVSSSDIPCIGDVDNDGNLEMIASRIYRWDNNNNVWNLVDSFKGAISGQFFAYADFGTLRDDGSFDYTQKDGIAEIVGVGSSVTLATITGKSLMSVQFQNVSATGGPPNIGDFDGDGMPEIGVAGKNNMTVIDPQCKAGVDGCLRDYILWQSVSQDQSSGQTGSSTFDFDSDGRMEVVYGDECYTRVYDGKTGEVLFSNYRTSNTANENPTIVDVDNDMSAEIIMGGDAIAPACPTIDPNHHGVRCVEDSDCFSKKCVKGYCRCNSDSECNSQYDGNGQLWDIYSCTTPLSPQSALDGQVCRAKHPTGIKRPGFRILRDRLDRWASTRSIWNQHAYSVTNVNDDGSIPKGSEWKMNFLDPELNNYRQNAQGKIGAGYAPDITGRLDESSACVQGVDQTIHIGGTLCNRGVKDVGSRLPATFYLGDPADNKILCTSYTDSNVVSGECRRVECTVNEPVAGMITMVVNDDGKGGRTTVECDTSNNRDSITITECKVN